MNNFSHIQRRPHTTSSPRTSARDVAPSSHANTSADSDILKHGTTNSNAGALSHSRAPLSSAMTLQSHNSVLAEYMYEWDMGKGTVGLGPERAQHDLQSAVNARREQYWVRKRLQEAQDHAALSQASAQQKASGTASRQQRRLYQAIETERRNQLIQQRVAERKKLEVSVKQHQERAREDRINRITAIREHAQWARDHHRIEAARRRAEDLEHKRLQNMEMLAFIEAGRKANQQHQHHTIELQKKKREADEVIAQQRLEEKAAFLQHELEHIRARQQQKELDCRAERTTALEQLHQFTKAQQTEYKENLWKRREALRARSAEVNRCVKMLKKDLTETVAKNRYLEVQRMQDMVRQIREWETKASTLRNERYKTKSKKKSPILSDTTTHQRKNSSN